MTSVTYYGGFKDGEKALLDETEMEEYESAMIPFRHGYYLRSVRFPGSLVTVPILTQNPNLRGDELKGAIQ